MLTEPCDLLYGRKMRPMTFPSKLLQWMSHSFAVLQEGFLGSFFFFIGRSTSASRLIIYESIVLGKNYQKKKGAIYEISFGLIA